MLHASMARSSASDACVPPCFQVDEPAVWSELGHAQLDNGLVAEAIASYLRSNDTSRSSDVIERSKEVRGPSLRFLAWCL